MKAKLIIEDKEIEVEISEEEYKKLQPSEEKKTGYERISKNSEYYYVATKGIVEFGADEMKETLSCVITDLRNMANEFEELLNIMDSLTAEEFDNKSMEIQNKYDKKHIVIM